jgi:uncharacterized protein
MSSSRGRQRFFRRLALATFGLIVGGVTASWFVAAQLVASCPRTIGAPPVDLPATAISLASDSGSVVAGWHIPAENSKGVVVLLHGIRGSRLSMLDRARWLHAAGYSIVMIDLHAHGESPGDRITLGHLEKHDVRAAVAFARESHPNEPIGVLGVSLGGASALLASPLGIDALVLESVYPTIEDAVRNRVASRLGWMSIVPTELLLAQLKPRLGVSLSELRPIDCLPRVGCPVLLLSGREDASTTAAETREMFSVASEPKQLWLVDGAAHVDLCRAAPDEYKTGVLRFLDQHMRRQR